MTVTEQQLVEWLAAGQAAMEGAQFVEAAQAFERVRRALPGMSAIAAMAGQAWQLAGRVAEARAAYREVWQHADRSDIAAVYELGSTLLALGAPFEARECYDVVSRARPQDPAVWSALASATRAAGDPDTAWPLIQRALGARPDEATFVLTAAQIRHALGDLEGATDWLRKATALRPDHAGTQMQGAFTTLMRGPSAEGWRLFEARQRPAAIAGTRDWHGEPLDGQRIIVIGEQGLGDQFHFVRFAHRLAEHGASRTTIAVARAIVPLLRASGFDAVAFDDIPEAEWSVPLLSLPHRLGLEGETDGATPYLSCSAAPADAPSTTANTTRRVGIVWKGNPEFAATVLRDVDPTLLAALTDVPDVEWVSLQFGEAVPASCAHIAPMPPVSDWLDTARLVGALDAIVSVDTSVAHLAGAMHKPVVMLVPFSPDWRWGLHHETTPWYPTMSLARQPAPRDWAGTIPQVHRVLAAMPPRSPDPSR